MEYLVFTSNNALASALAEHLPLTPLKDGKDLVVPASTRLVFVDSSANDAEAALLRLAEQSDALGVIFLHTGSVRPAFMSGFNGMSEILSAPFRLGDMLDAAQRLSQQLESARKQSLALTKELTLLPAARELRHATSVERITLTEKEALLLSTLHAAGAAGLAKDALLHAVWGYQDGVDTHTLETHIYRLRQKIRDFASEREAIRFKDGVYTIDF